MGIYITLARFLPLTWLIIAVILGIVEASTLDLVSIWFAVGALLTILPASFGAPFVVQLLFFFASSLIILVFTRPMAKKILKVKKVSTNADSIIGMVGIVVQPINNVLGEGRVMVNGMEWAARSDDGAPVGEKESVLIKSIEGVKVIVERLA